MLLGWKSFSKHKLGEIIKLQTENTNLINLQIVFAYQLNSTIWKWFKNMK